MFNSKVSKKRTFTIVTKFKWRLRWCGGRQWNNARDSRLNMRTHKIVTAGARWPEVYMANTDHLDNEAIKSKCILYKTLFYRIKWRWFRHKIFSVHSLLNELTTVKLSRVLRWLLANVVNERRDVYSVMTWRSMLTGFFWVRTVTFCFELIPLKKLEDCSRKGSK